VSIEFWLRFEPQICLPRLTINFLFVTARAERKVRFFVKLFDFFREWIHIRLPWNLSRFAANSVEILGWNFRKKLFRENFLEILCKPRLYPLPKLVKFRPNFCNYILGPYCAEKNSRKHFRMLFAPRQWGTSINESQKRYGEEKQGRFIFGKPDLFTLGLGLTMPYSLGILVWNFYHTFVTVSIEFWLRFEH